MIKRKLLICFTALVLSLFSSSSFSDDGFNAVNAGKDNTKAVDTRVMHVTQLSYLEREPGIDDYAVTMLVSDRFIRIDETEEGSGFIVYDDKEKTIYSVSHSDKSVLIIKPYAFSAKTSPVEYFTEYLLLEDAPKVANKKMFNYRVFVKQKMADDKVQEHTCLEIQLAEEFMPKVRKLLQNYQKVVSGQQVKMVDNKVTEMQSPCFYVDQVYNEGRYYEKGLPIQEWHSNGRFKVLTSFKETEVQSELFSIPADYHQFSVDKDSKRFLQ